MRDREMKFMKKARRGKKLGVIEAFVMKWHGKRDGSRGLPRCDIASEWTSPFLDGETKAYGKLVYSLWKSTHERQKATYAKLEDLTKKLLVYESEKPTSELSKTINLRKTGEDSLSDDQVRDRRKRETEKELSKRRDVHNEATSLIGNILQENTSCRLLCKAARQYFGERRVSYWDGVLVTNSNERIPLSPPSIPSIEEDAEKLYTASHEPIVREYIDLVERFKSLFPLNEQEV